ncbi:1-aminocyclopropane-1-carboxylate deaminase/D-cysteine desulfhydrase [Chitinophaga rhizosphaerae]|uniref:1-aminocyclopropane-1-carboxylate deaminase/D-cysteine desulfhydrase n=1 Tax=Chitinophaga rhizosphaerae TaxID=1864947 RepID=UPI0013DF82AC|nr:pyridoxal-phosphate dependent enzyme [Chitinophaga rhizosphaerae]
MLRLDLVHPLVQGNKWFKLKRNLEAAGPLPVVTFGGPWSNHLHAAAAACKLMGKPVTGIVRGEAPAPPSRTLTEAAALGMEIVHVPRAVYDAIKKGDLSAAGAEFATDSRAAGGPADKPFSLRTLLETAYIIPEGGGNAEGAAGCEEILDLGDFRPFTHILCATGTGTTLAGLINGAAKRGIGAEIWGISALKGAYSVESEVRALLTEDRGNWGILHDFHEGGFAKISHALITGMNDFFDQTGIPTDRVYTGKLVLAFREMSAEGRFPPGSHVLLIHTGGLQGNASLPQGSLHF